MNELKLKTVTMEELEVLFDTLAFSITGFRTWEKVKQAEKIRESFNVEVDERTLYILEDSTLQEDILDKKLLLNNLNLYNGRESEFWDDSSDVFGGY